MDFKRFVKFFLFLIVCFSYFDVYARRGCCSWHGGVSSTCRYGKIVCNDGTTSPSCTCSGGVEYTPPKIYGCTDSNALNYNPSANTNDGSCIRRIYGCMDPNAFNFDSNANTDNGTCIAKVFGCINKSANNYNIDANTDDGSCLFTKNKVIYKKIKYKTKYVYKLFKKNGAVIQKGINGKKKITKEIIVNEANEIIESKIIDTEVLDEPVSKIVVSKKKK